jgi:molybdopterin synthase catalytic subunit/molybdopterin converting factor small subunit
VGVAYAVTVSYFAGARDLAGCAEEQLVLPAPEISAAELRTLLAARHVRLAAYLPRMRLALNDELRAVEATIRAGDRVAVLPPVAGGCVPLCALRDTVLSVDEAIAAVAHPGAGGIALFLGVVRDHAERADAGRAEVARLDYEAHPVLAAEELRRVLGELQVEHAGTRLCALHRVGELAIGDIAVIVAASAAHRAEAFAACRAAIDRIKQSVPIWKKEWAADGSALWVNLDE